MNRRRADQACQRQQAQRPEVTQAGRCWRRLRPRHWNWNWNWNWHWHWQRSWLQLRCLRWPERLQLLARLRILRHQFQIAQQGHPRYVIGQGARALLLKRLKRLRAHARQNQGFGQFAVEALVVDERAQDGGAFRAGGAVWEAGHRFKGPVTVIEGGAGAWLQRLADLKMDALKAWGAHQMQCVKGLAARLHVTQRRRNREPKIQSPE